MQSKVSTRMCSTNPKVSSLGYGELTPSLCVSLDYTCIALDFLCCLCK